VADSSSYADATDASASSYSASSERALAAADAAVAASAAAAAAAAAPGVAAVADAARATAPADALLLAGPLEAHVCVDLAAVAAALRRTDAEADSSGLIVNGEHA
jgi:hypothetical protein